MLCASGDTGRCGERPKWREARAEARAVASVVGREALRECVHQRGRSVWCCAPVEKECVCVCVVRETEGEERAAARASSAVVGRKALRL